MTRPAHAIRATTLLIGLAVLAACDGGRASGGAPPTPTAYHYVLQMAPGGLREGTLVLDGKDVGPLAEGQGSVELPSATWLGDRKLGLRVATTCGLEEIPLELSLARSVEEQRRKQARAGEKGVRLVGNFIVKGQEPPAALLYLDARRGPPTDVTVGKQVFAAVQTGKVSVRVGTCDEARTIRVGEVEIGALAPAGKALVVDVNGGQCAKLEELRFATPGMKASPPAPPEILQGRRTYEVPLEITYVFSPPPTSIDGGGAIGKTLWALTSCS
jgi:hypothetical protein